MIYFDHAATSYPKPESVINAFTECIKEFGGNPGRSGHSLSILASEAVYSCREELALLLHVCPEQIVFTQNATHALNLAIRTRVKPGSHILISDQEHNASFRVVHALAEQEIITYDFFSSEACSQTELESRLRPETDMLVCNLTSNVTGNTLPLDLLIAMAKKHGLYLILDASQWLGHRFIPQAIRDADAVCAPGHKGLFGIQGSGFVYLKNGEALPPFLFGGSGIESENAGMPKHLPERFEPGTLATPAIASLRAGVRFVVDIGLEEIEEHESMLVRRCYDILSDFPMLRIHSKPQTCSSLMSFSHPRIPSEQLADEINRFGICVRGGFHCAPIVHRSQIKVSGGAVRLSFGITNTVAELDSLYVALKEILRL